MQQIQSQYVHSTPLSTNSPSSRSVATNTLNGLLPLHRLSQTSANALSLPPNQSQNQSRLLLNFNNQLKRSKKIKYMLLIIILTVTFAFLLITTIELSTTLVKDRREKDLSLSVDKISNLTRITNETKSEEEKTSPIRSFFAFIWLFNVFLFLICLFTHLFLYRKHSQRGRAKAAFLRECVQIFDNEKCSANNKFVDYLIKTCLLCILWYLSCYLIFRSMAILISSQIIILISIKITLRQILGWIFLHEQFIGHKIIAHILALSALLFLSHDNGFRFNKSLFALSMVTCAVAMKTIFDILMTGFIKSLTNSKYRTVMINVCLCGTCFLWPLVFIFHVTRIEPIYSHHFYSFLTIIAFISALLFNVLTITISLKSTSLANVAAFILVIPSISLIDRYLLNIKYSPLFILSIVCSLSSVLLSMIPKEGFQSSERIKMKQALGLINKESNTNVAAGLLPSGGTTTRTSSAFQEIKAQRLIRNAFLFNESKT
ncbi:unnamed protein product [Rotaria sordida]|uniref:Uncharacterized protein n=1 Tax=Rotaria sordida TaxID=392033 RepID=A0A813TL31_9BILA|nr:unnamed protein product [Rotaria sordida]